MIIVEYNNDYLDLGNIIDLCALINCKAEGDFDLYLAGSGSTKSSLTFLYFKSKTLFSSFFPPC